MVLEKIKYKAGNMKIEYVNRGTDMVVVLDSKKHTEDLDTLIGHLQKFRSYVNLKSELRIPEDDWNLINVVGLEFHTEEKKGLGKGVRFFYEVYLRNHMPYETIEGISPFTYLKCNYSNLLVPQTVRSELELFSDSVLDTARVFMKADQKQPTLFQIDEERKEELDHA
ncbi:hypothetical protein [Leptospira sp. GIMC2001]|uniref:hypothetical protein n=1 Tax=Leptospira sp. GIMC2001 TaxID=1513297 RepID=UPI00234A2F99|nr:hypothetical protein [Leptospira sp. GIMC2001]WCL51453.1 hypothetical protein O4O04_20265 [Leptospira sp. GIMC2001]